MKSGKNLVSRDEKVSRHDIVETFESDFLLVIEWQYNKGVSSLFPPHVQHWGDASGCSYHVSHVPGKFCL